MDTEVIAFRYALQVKCQMHQHTYVRYWAAVIFSVHSGQYVDGLVQTAVTLANALELLQSCTKPSMYFTISAEFASPAIGQSHYCSRASEGIVENIFVKWLVFIHNKLQHHTNQVHISLGILYLFFIRIMEHVHYHYINYLVIHVIPRKTLAWQATLWMSTCDCLCPIM